MRRPATIPLPASEGSASTAYYALHTRPATCYRPHHAAHVLLTLQEPSEARHSWEAREDGWGAYTSARIKKLSRKARGGTAHAAPTAAADLRSTDSDPPTGRSDRADARSMLHAGASDRAACGSRAIASAAPGCGPGPHWRGGPLTWPAASAACASGCREEVGMCTPDTVSCQLRVGERHRGQTGASLSRALRQLNSTPLSPAHRRIRFLRHCRGKRWERAREQWSIAGCSRASSGKSTLPPRGVVQPAVMHGIAAEATGPRDERSCQLMSTLVAAAERSEAAWAAWATQWSSMMACDSRCAPAGLDAELPQAGAGWALGCRPHRCATGMTPRPSSPTAAGASVSPWHAFCLLQVK